MSNLVGKVCASSFGVAWWMLLFCGGGIAAVHSLILYTIWSPGLEGAACQPDAWSYSRNSLAPPVWQALAPLLPVSSSTPLGDNTHPGSTGQSSARHRWPVPCCCFSLPLTLVSNVSEVIQNSLISAFDR